MLGPLHRPKPARRPDRLPRRARLALALALALTALVAGVLPAGAAAAEDELRAMTYNIKGNVSFRDGVWAPAEVAAAIGAEDADVVGLQEVCDWQLEDLSDRLLGQGYEHYQHVTTVPTASCGNYGIGLLSKLPLDDYDSVPLPEHDEPRAVQGATVSAGGASVRVYNTHLSPGAGLIQSEALATEAADSTIARTVLLADLNMTPSHAGLQPLADHGFREVDHPRNLPTFSYSNPVSKLDYIYVSGPLEVGDVTVTSTPASDHLPLRTDLGVGPDLAAENGAIAFASSRDGSGSSFDIHTVRDDGSEPLELTDDGAVNTDPEWSDDGSRIAFASKPDGAADSAYELWVMDADGGNAVQLTDNAIADRDPTFSPDGTEIAFRRELPGSPTNNNEIFRIAVDGSDPVNLTGHPASDFNPDFSPDGETIAFQRFTSGSGVGFGNEIYAMNADGSGQTNLTGNHSANNDGQPSWSPDGGLIAFHSNRDGNFEIYTMSSTGGSLSRRTNDAGSDQKPSWSPDGSRIAIQSNRDGNNEIYTMDASGANPTRLTDDPGSDIFPAWGYVDTTPPETAIDSGPAGTDNDPTPELSFSSDRPDAVFECRLDADAGGEWEACSSPHVLATLADGEHSFEVRAISAAGIADPTPAERTFTIDTTAPTTTIDSGPADGSHTNETDPSFGFSADEGADFADGEHSFEVRATDAVGNTGAADARTFTVDTVAPTATIDADPAEGTTTNQTDQSFEFAADETADFECRLDSDDAADWEDCSSPQDYTDLADGEHSFEVRAIDVAGNVGGSESRTFTVDTTAPTSTIDSGPADGSTIGEADLSFEFSADETGSSFECRLDSADAADWQACSSPQDYADLADGEHSFEVRATDAVANVGAADSRTFTVDTVAPSTTIDSGSTGPTDHRPSFSFSSSEAGSSFECRLDSTDEADWEACSSPHRVAPLANGEHRFEVRAVDAAGNVDPDGASVGFLVERAPDTTITRGPGKFTRDRTPTFRFAADEPDVSFECRLDSASAGDWQPCASPWTPSELTDGEHNFEVRAIDARAARDPAPAVHAFTVDTVAPRTTITGGPAEGELTNSATPRFELSASAQGAVDPSTFECRIDGWFWERCEPAQVTAELADGEHSFEARATDRAGNVERIPVSRRFIVDTLAPETTIVPGPAGDGRSTFVFRSDDPDSTFHCRLDSAAAEDWEPCTSPQQYEELAEGRHRFQVRATDPAGNADPSPASRRFEVDTRLAGPRVRARPLQRQRGRRVMIKLRVGAAEPAVVRARGLIKLGKRRFKLAQSTRTIGSGGMRTLRLRPARHKQDARLSRALARGRKAWARIAVTISDGPANSTTRKRAVRLR